MDVKEAVAAAKKYVTEVFFEEIDARPRLEEVWFNHEKNEWYVTLTIWRRTAEAKHTLAMTGPSELKVVCISDTDGKPLSIRNREPMPAWR